MNGVVGSESFETRWVGGSESQASVVSVYGLYTDQNDQIDIPAYHTRVIVTSLNFCGCSRS